LCFVWVCGYIGVFMCVGGCVWVGANICGMTLLFVWHDIYIRMTCSVLQCVAVCCSVLQCVAVCCSVLQCVAVYS